MNKSQKILFVITKGNSGGAQKYVFDIATNLPKEKFEPIVACGTKEGAFLLEKLKEDGIRTIELKDSEREIKIKNDFKTAKELINIIKKEKPNIIHLNSSKIGLLGSLAVLYFKISTSDSKPKSIFTAHNWAFNYEGNSIISNFIYYLSHYFTVLFCDTTICVSEKIKNDIAWFPFVQNKIKVVYNGISEFELLSKEESRSILASKNTNKNIILSIGELHKNKGLDTALKGIAMLPIEIREKIIYCIAGNGEERGNLEKLVDELNLKNIVRFLGFVPDAKKLISGCDIFLLPSRTEAFPYAILEAGFAKSPIIATSVGGIPEIIHDMQNGILVHPKNPKEIAEAILYMIDHPEKMSEFGSEIRKTVTNFFSLDKMLQDTTRLYDFLN